MITYVNTVLVSNDSDKTPIQSQADLIKTSKQAVEALKGSYVILPVPSDNMSTEVTRTDKIKIGVVGQGYTTFVQKVNGVDTVKYAANVKWSNEIKIADIKSVAVTLFGHDGGNVIEPAQSFDTPLEDTITVDFSNVNTSNLDGCVAVLRINYKDMPTRYRQWTESYDHIIKSGEDLAAAFANTITKQSRRARVFASAASNVLTLTAMPYDDDMDPNGENPVGKVRFNVSLYYTNPSAPGFASSNKNELVAPEDIEKTPGITPVGSGKYVLEHEKNALGYTGVIHRCKWYDLKPSIVADPTKNYDCITLEFENMYRAADDIFRKTKQTVELYFAQGNDGSSNINSVKTIIDGLIAKFPTVKEVEVPAGNNNNEGGGN